MQKERRLTNYVFNSPPPWWNHFWEAGNHQTSQEISCCNKTPNSVSQKTLFTVSWIHYKHCEVSLCHGSSYKANCLLWCYTV